MTSIIILILLILAAFFLGWLISKLLFKGDSSADYGDLSAQIAEKEAALEACRKQNASLHASIASHQSAAKSFVAEAPVAAALVADEPVIAPIVAAAPVVERVDDLKIVEGIGPKIAELLNNAGIKTFAQLENTSVDRLNEILDAGGSQYKMHDPATWPTQAGLANSGKWTELKILQDELNGGVGTASGSKAADLADAGRVDDLKIVEGIGPKIEELLNNAGIKTFAQLASTSVARLNEILEAAGPRYQMHDPGTWPQQSGLANEGKWTELKVLQDELNKGKAE